MPEEKEKKAEQEAQEGSEIDREVADLIRAERRKGSRRGPRDEAAERKKQRLAADGLRAIKAKDARRFTELLRLAGIRENSPEWKNAWKVFYSA